MRCITAIVATLLLLGDASWGDEPAFDASAASQFFDRLDSNGDGKVTLKEAPPQGKMLVEFLLSHLAKGSSDHLERADFVQFANRQTNGKNQRRTEAAAFRAAHGPTNPAHCPACAMGLTAKFVFDRLDVNEDGFVTSTEFRRSPGMNDEQKARDTVARLDNNGDHKLSWAELETAYNARHQNCKKPASDSIAAKADKQRADGRGDASRFAQVFILRSDTNRDGKISKEEFRGPAFGFERLDKNGNGFVESDELGDLHQRRLNDPKSMKERLESGDVPQPSDAGLGRGLRTPDSNK